MVFYERQVEPKGKTHGNSDSKDFCGDPRFLTMVSSNIVTNSVRNTGNTLLAITFDPLGKDGPVTCLGYDDNEECRRFSTSVWIMIGNKNSQFLLC